jgi:hypothetical protein
MSKKDTHAEYKRLASLVTESDYDTGSEWITQSADLVKRFFTTTSDMEINFGAVVGNELAESDIPRLLVALDCLPVRDYALGLLDYTNPTHIIALEHLVKVSPKAVSYAPATILAVAKFEAGDKASALEILRQYPSYPLAGLVVRVIEAGWRSEEFSKMRKELHQKVIESIYA